MAKRRKSKQLTLWVEAVGATKPKDPALEETMRDARDILEWRLGPNVPGWRVYRLAELLRGQGG